MLIYNLRPHHALCISFFEGKGYSADFTENMTDTIKMLESCNPYVRLVYETDIICSHCPNNINGICVTSEKVLEYDLKTANLCGLSENDIILWSDFHNLAMKNIIKKTGIASVCCDCSWRYICSEKNKKLCDMSI